MLKIARLGRRQGDYYIDTVAKGIEDYYAGAGEAPGRWRGSGVAALGLGGEVDADTLRAVLNGVLPGVEAPLAGAGGRRTPGWDLTFSPPKSVSLLYGLGERDTARQVAAAHEAAVDAGLAYLERWALATRRRHGGRIVTEAGQGMIVAAFRHRTSREGDPQLHTHALLANAVQRSDGTWGAIDSRVIYRQALAGGYVYQAVLRSQLTERLGVGWQPVQRGYAELADVPAALHTPFSKRRQQIEAALDDRGVSSAKAAQIAALQTRRAKGEAVGTDVLRARWRDEAAELGVEWGDVQSAVGRLPANEVRQQVSTAQRRRVNDDLLGPDGLTKQRTSFQRGELTRAWCEAIDPATVGINAATIDTLAETTIGDRRSVLLGADDPLRGLDRRRWSSQNLLDVESRILERVAAGRDQHVGTVPQRAIRRGLKAHPTLSEEQQTMVDTLTANGHRIDAVVGVAGSGKTHALAVANELWTNAGYHTIGATISKRAATQLQTDSGIPSSTLAALLLDLQRTPGDVPTNTVVVVDEAGMVPTRTIDELLDHCGRDVKVVLVGDHRQLPEIDAGGMLRSLAEHHELATLRDNRRQRDVEERAALAEIRHGHVGVGLDWYVQSGRVASFEDSAAARATMIDTWWSERDGPASQQLMAERRVDVERLNVAARQRRRDAGELDVSDVVVVGNRDFALGDVVIFERNDQRMRVANGQRGRVTGLNRAGGELSVEMEDGRAVNVDRNYLRDEHLNWGYAATVHKNQGATCDHAYLLASDRTYRELGYVALSRGRDSNRIWTVSEHDPLLDDAPAHGADRAPPDPLADLRTTMQRSAAHQLASDQADELEPVGIDL